jgi:DNA-binding CsgD family transcriptional regulator
MMRESANLVRQSPQETSGSTVSPLSVSHVRLIDDAAKKAGFDYFLMAHFPRGDSAGFADNRIACNWPKALIDDYSGADLFHRSQMVFAMKRTNMPVFCDCAGFEVSSANGDGKPFDGRFAAHGLRRTFAFSLHDAALRHYIFAFSGIRAALSQPESMELVYGSMQILEGFVRHAKAADEPAERLSNREIECLRWSAAGKSSEEIAIILGLSAHTVASYLRSAMRKLNSVNRMQAVARAFRYRLL